MRILTCTAAISILLMGCFGGESPEALCPQVIVGKVITNHLACAGIAVQVTGESIPQGILQSSYTDSFGNTFENVFRVTNICELPEEDVNWLSATENVGVECPFYVVGRSIDDLCAYCKPYVVLPDTAFVIALAKGPCNDQVQYAD